ncbi:MAG TPA: MraY family glycosyltransferase, partial [Anaerolineales bacterium]|nr:MraY family glycosyltransferase [Anaerolineales bacterium]
MSLSFSTVLIINLLTALLLTLVCAWVGILLANRWGLIDVPGSAPHKKHAAPTPLAGGLALLLVLSVLYLVFDFSATPEIRAIFASGAVVFAFGLLDDFRGVSPPVKLLGQTLGFVVLAALGVYIRIFESPEFFIYGQGGVYVLLDLALTFFWMVGITNAFNFVDSMDGLSVALAGIAAAFFMWATIDAGQPALTQLSAVLMGVCLALYFFNAPPARLFLGDAGAQTLGFFLAALAIVYTPRAFSQTSSWFAPMLFLGVPIFDAVLVVIARLRERKPVYRSARDHTFHRLVAAGLEPNRAVLLMHFGAFVLGCLAIAALDLPPFPANAI